ncbi:MAG: MBL fold metallo-hydrolase, partial [Dehalococcoidia bacterium]
STLMDRRRWLVLAGATAAGASGIVLALGGKRRLGIVTQPATAGGKSDMLRVNLGFVSAYLVMRGNAAALVDSGVEGSADAIGDVLQGAGLGWDSLQHLILTHNHRDHQGSAAAVLERAPRALVWAGPPDIPGIMVNRDVRPANDGDDLFGLRVIATPGHTPGHISLLDPELSTLLTGDALFTQNDILSGSPERFNADTAQANQSSRRLGELTFERALFGHGEPIEHGASAAVRQLGTTLP